MDSPPVVFSYAKWTVRYPEFSTISEPLAQAYFDEAGLYCANSISNPALAILPTLLNMLTAHIAALYLVRSGVPASSLVGRITDATEGSVSVSVESDYEPGTPQWYQQTKYGSSYWAATAPYRTAHYAALPTRVPSGVYPFRPGRVF